MLKFAILFLSFVLLGCCGSAWAQMAAQDVPVAVASEIYYNFLDFNDEVDDLSHIIGFGPLSWSNGVARTLNPARYPELMGYMLNIMNKYTTEDVGEYDYMTFWNVSSGSLGYTENINGTGRAVIAQGIIAYMVTGRIYGQDQHCSEYRITKIGNDAYRVSAECALSSTLARPDCLYTIGQGNPMPLIKGVTSTDAPCFLVDPREGMRAVSRVEKYHDYRRVNGKYLISRIVNGFRNRVAELEPHMASTPYPLGPMTAGRPWLNAYPGLPASVAEGGNN